MNLVHIICIAVLLATFIRAAQDQVEHEKMKKVEQSINRHEAYPFYLIHKSRLPEALPVPGAAGLNVPSRKPCKHFCFICMSKKIVKSRS